MPGLRVLPVEFRFAPNENAAAFYQPLLEASASMATEADLARVRPLAQAKAQAQAQSICVAFERQKEVNYYYRLRLYRPEAFFLREVNGHRR